MRRRRSTRLEASRTNHLTRSEELDHADWTKSNVTVTADAATAPDGATTADNLSDTSASAHGFVSQAHTVADDSADDAASVHFAKKATDHIAMVALEYTGGTTELTYEAEINLNGGGTDVSNSPDAPTRVVVEDWGDFWRVSVVGANNGTGNTTATALAYPHVGTTLGTRDVSVTGDADVWGVQLEDGPFPSSYIATTTAAVTRAADSATDGYTSSPQAQTIYGKVVLWQTDEGSGLCVVGDETDGMRVFIASTNRLSAELFNAGSFNQSRSGSGGIGHDPGDVLEFRAVFESDGSTTIHWSIDGGTEQSAVTDSGESLPASFGRSSVQVGASWDGNLKAPGFCDWIALTISSGVKTMDEMRKLARTKASP